MTCDEARDRLNDFVDGALSDDESAELADHMLVCAACRQEEEQQRAFLLEAIALPACVEPSRDLWPAIAVQLELGAPSATKVGSRWPFTPRSAFAVAACAILALGLGLLGYGYLRNPAELGNAQRLAREVSDADREFARAHEKFLAEYRARGAALTPDTRRVVDENLAIIDKALEEIRSSLTQSPDNARLAKLLLDTQNQEIDLIRLATALSDGG